MAADSACISTVNPRGWYGSSMKTTFTSHEQIAEDVMELMTLMNVRKALVAGYSTGGGIAFKLTHKYPEIFPAAFLMNSIALDGMTSFFDEDGNPFQPEPFAELMASGWSDDMTAETVIQQQWAPFASTPERFPPATHGIAAYLRDGAVKMSCKKEALVANMRFNVSPIKTVYSEPSTDLSTLKSKVIVLHGDNDILIPTEQVELVTKLAIKERWAKPGLLSFYKYGGGHMSFFDDPQAVASVYRKAFEEQIISIDDVAKIAS